MRTTRREIIEIVRLYAIATGIVVLGFIAIALPNFVQSGSSVSITTPELRPPYIMQ